MHTSITCPTYTANIYQRHIFVVHTIFLFKFSLSKLANIFNQPLLLIGSRQAHEPIHVKNGIPAKLINSWKTILDNYENLGCYYPSQTNFLKLNSQCPQCCHQNSYSSQPHYFLSLCTKILMREIKWQPSKYGKGNTKMITYKLQQQFLICPLSI